MSLLVAVALVDKVFTTDIAFKDFDYARLFEIDPSMVAASEFFFLESLDWNVSISPDEWASVLSLSERISSLYPPHSHVQPHHHSPVFVPLAPSVPHPSLLSRFFAMVSRTFSSGFSP
jgi:hypothetical protein